MCGSAQKLPEMAKEKQKSSKISLISLEIREAGNYTIKLKEFLPDKNHYFSPTFLFQIVHTLSSTYIF